MIFIYSIKYNLYSLAIFHFLLLNKQIYINKEHLRLCSKSIMVIRIFRSIIYNTCFTRSLNLCRFSFKHNWSNLCNLFLSQFTAMHYYEIEAQKCMRSIFLSISMIFFCFHGIHRKQYQKCLIQTAYVLHNILFNSYIPLFEKERTIDHNLL